MRHSCDTGRAQRKLRRWTDPVDRTGEFAKHIFRKHSKMAAGGRTELLSYKKKIEGEWCQNKQGGLVEECKKRGSWLRELSSKLWIEEVVDGSQGGTSVEQMLCDAGRDQRMWIYCFGHYVRLKDG